MRVKNWQQAFREHIAKYRTQPFEWGVHDCALFAARGVDAIRGTNTADEIYKDFEVKSAWDYMNLIDKEGSLSDMVMARFGNVVGPQVPFGFCSVGDVLVLQYEGRQVLALHEGHAAIAPGPTRLEVLPLEGIAVSGWKI